MTRRKVEILAAFTLLALLVASLLWLLLRQPAPDPGESPEDNVATDELPAVNPADVPQQDAVAAATVSRTFVERFGSYSSESDFANVDDVMALATARFQAELEGLVTEYRASTGDNEQYTGISTYVIASKILSETATTAILSITTQRKESVGNPGNSTVRYQDVEVALVKEGDDWLVDDLTWK